MQTQGNPSKWKSIANAVAAFALAAYAVLHFTGLDVILHPSHYGDFGLFLEGSTVIAVTPGLSASKAGIQVGDVVNRPPALRDRFRLNYGFPELWPGERIAVSVHRSGKPHTVTLEAATPPASAAYNIQLVLTDIGLLVFIGVGLILVLLRPTRMTWAFFLLAAAFTFFSAQPALHMPMRWRIAVDNLNVVLIMAAVVSFPVFCARFPSIEPSGWRSAIDRFAPYLFLPSAGLLAWHEFANLDLAPRSLVVRLDNALTAFDSLMFIVGTVVLSHTYFVARGLERNKIKWVVLGLICATLSAITAAVGTFETSLVPFTWLNSTSGLSSAVGFAVGLLFVVLPITVAYAVLRHRVIDIRFVLQRSLAVGVIAGLVVGIIVGIDWLFSAWLPASRLASLVYVGVILFVGFFLNAARQRIGKAVDFLFFRQWHRTQEQSNAIADTIAHARSKADLYEPLTGGIAGAFSLASAALFERVEDGGFVRVAAQGWPTGTIWHILPDDPLVKRADERRGVVDVDSFEWSERDLPSGVARPSVMVPIAVGKRVPAILLYGAHNNGTVLDPDEIRIIRGIAVDASLLYGTIMTDSGPTVLGERMAGAYH